MRRNTGIRIHAQLWDDLQRLADATSGRFTRNQLAEHAIAEYVARERRRKPRGGRGVDLAEKADEVGPVSGSEPSVINSGDASTSADITPA